MCDLARKEMMNIEKVGMSNDEYRTLNFEQTVIRHSTFFGSSFDI